jgi:hypothetical protein
VKEDSKDELIPQEVTDALATSMLAPIPIPYSIDRHIVAENSGVGVRATLWAAEKTRVIVNSTYEETIKTATEEAGNYASKVPFVLAPAAAIIGLKKGAIKGLFKGIGKGILKKVSW